MRNEDKRKRERELVSQRDFEAQRKERRRRTFSFFLLLLFLSFLWATTEEKGNKSDSFNLLLGRRPNGLMLDVLRDLSCPSSGISPGLSHPMEVIQFLFCFRLLLSPRPNSLVVLLRLSFYNTPSCSTLSSLYYYCVHTSCSLSTFTLFFRWVGGSLYSHLSNGIENNVINIRSPCAVCPHFSWFFVWNSRIVFFFFFCFYYLSPYIIELDLFLKYHR